MPRVPSTLTSAPALALTAAALFGASTPVAKRLLDDVSPMMLAGLLYLGSGIGLSLAKVVARRAPSGPDRTRGIRGASGARDARSSVKGASSVPL